VDFASEFFLCGSVFRIVATHLRSGFQLLNFHWRATHEGGIRSMPQLEAFPDHTNFIFARIDGQS
jgi:hypothetical protein